jgi:Uma2 family endonuclease
MPVAERLTAEEFLALPVPEVGRPWNLVDGEVVVNDPTALHGDVLEVLLFAFGSWTRATPGRGKVALSRDLRIDGRNVFVPDLLWYRDGRVPDPYDQPPYPIPDLAVEVRSPSTWRFDRGLKRAGYEREGLPELWLVDTEARRVQVLRRAGPTAPRFDVELEIGTDGILASPLLPGFELPLAGVFPERRR